MNIPPPMRQSDPTLTSLVDVPVHINTSRSYQCMLLIGITFGLFEILFLILYGNDFWFILNLASYGTSAVFISAAAAHFLLLFLESPAGCNLFKPVKHGLPLLFYRSWLAVDMEGFTIGSRRVLWQAAKEFRLTAFGNLQIISDSVCGKGMQDIVLVFPFHCANQLDQLRFLSAARAGNPQLAINRRLERTLNSKNTRISCALQGLTVVVLLFVFLDLGCESFRLLENIKDYFLAQTEARLGRTDLAEHSLSSGDQILQHPSNISWVNTKLFKVGVVAAQLYQARSQALWELNRKQEALADAKKAVGLNPHNFRLNLRMARILESLGEIRLAREQITEAINNRSDLLLPRLYFLAVQREDKKVDSVQQFYRITMDHFHDEVFGDEPWWPPGGNRFLSETIYQNDLRFVLDRFLDYHK